MQSAGESQAKRDEELARLVMQSAPPLPSEAPKPPWRPKVAGRIAFFFGPLAGALVVAISLRRMGYPERAKRILFLGLGAAAIESLVLSLIPDALARLAGIGAEIGFLLFFPPLMTGQFGEWQAAHPDVAPSNGWTAIGWGIVGAILLFVIAFVLLLGLSPVLPQG